MLFNKIVFVNGVDVYIKNKWYGIHFYWQSIPLFGIINTHRKCKTVREVGIIFLGLWIYFKVDK